MSNQIWQSPLLLNPYHEEIVQMLNRKPLLCQLSRFVGLKSDYKDSYGSGYYNLWTSGCTPERGRIFVRYDFASRQVHWEEYVDKIPGGYADFLCQDPFHVEVTQFIAKWVCSSSLDYPRDAMFRDIASQFPRRQWEIYQECPPLALHFFYNKDQIQVVRLSKGEVIGFIPAFLFRMTEFTPQAIFRLRKKLVRLLTGEGSPLSSEGDTAAAILLCRQNPFLSVTVSSDGRVRYHLDFSILPSCFINCLLSRFGEEGTADPTPDLSRICYPCDGGIEVIDLHRYMWDESQPELIHALMFSSGMELYLVTVPAPDDFIPGQATPGSLGCFRWNEAISVLKVRWTNISVLSDPASVADFVHRSATQSLDEVP